MKGREACGSVDVVAETGVLGASSSKQHFSF